jgi:hypothetical protein
MGLECEEIYELKQGWRKPKGKKCGKYDFCFKK